MLMITANTKATTQYNTCHMGIFIFIYDDVIIINNISFNITNYPIFDVC